MSDVSTLPPPTPTPPASPPPRSSRKRVVVITGVVGAVLALGITAGVVVGGGGTGDDHISGSFTLIVTDGVVGEWNDCYGDGGYDDFGAGMNVTIRNDEGTIVGSGDTRSLNDTDAQADGKLAEAVEIAQDGEDLLCVVTFDVPVEQSDFYDVEIGSRGTLSYSRHELIDDNWWIDSSLGSFED